MSFVYSFDLGGWVGFVPYPDRSFLWNSLTLLEREYLCSNCLVCRARSSWSDCSWPVNPWQRKKFLLSCPPGKIWRGQVNLTLSLFRLGRWWWWSDERDSTSSWMIIFRVPILKGHGKIPSHAPFSFTTQVNQIGKYWLTIAPRQGGVGCMMKGCSTPRATFWWRLIRLQPLKMAKVV